MSMQRHKLQHSGTVPACPTALFDMLKQASSCSSHIDMSREVSHEQDLLGRGTQQSHLVFFENNLRLFWAVA